MKNKLFFILILICYKILAQDTILLREITIKEKKSFNWQFKSIDNTKIELHSNNKIGDILNTEPAIIIKKQGSNGMYTISIMGTHNQHSLIIWNGMPIQSSLTGQFDYSQLHNNPNYPIGIYYGINSLQKNTGSLGGIISFEAQKRESLKNTTNLFLQWQSLLNQDISLSNTFTKSDFSTVNSFFFSKGKEQFNFKNIALLPIINCTQTAPYQNLEFNNTNYFNVKNINFIWANQFIDSKKEISPLMTAYFKSEHYEEQTNKAYRSIIKAEKELNNWNLEASAGINFATLGYFLNHSIKNINVTTINSYSNEQNFYTSIRLFNNNLKFAQISEHLQFIKNYGFFHDKKYDIRFSKFQHRILLTQDMLKFWTKHFTQKLVMIIMYSNNKISTLPALISKINITKNFSVYQSVGFNKRLPSLNDLFYIPGGNPNLKPEKAFQHDFSFVFTQVKKQYQLKVSTTSFYSKINDWILWSPTQFGFWQAHNVRNVNLFGFIFNIDNQWNFDRNFNLKSNFNYTLQDIKGNDGEYKILHNPYIPNHIVNLILKLTYKSIRYFVETQYLSKRYSMTYSDNFYLKPHLIANSSVSYTLKRKISITFSFKVNNVFNTYYQSIIWRIMPGRNFSLSIKFSI